MKLWKRGQGPADRVLAKHDAIEADIKRRDGVQESPGEPAADLTAGYEEVCTRQGRRKHLRAHPQLPVLCGWPGRMIPADPSLDVCLMCMAELRALTEAAS